MKHFGLSEDEIIRDWSLHAEDLAFVKKLRKLYCYMELGFSSSLHPNLASGLGIAEPAC